MLVVDVVVSVKIARASFRYTFSLAHKREPSHSRHSLLPSPAFVRPMPSVLYSVAECVCACVCEHEHGHTQIWHIQYFAGSESTCVRYPIAGYNQRSGKCICRRAVTVLQRVFSQHFFAHSCAWKTVPKKLKRSCMYVLQLKRRREKKEETNAKQREPSVCALCK